jgi:hypothetical protein
MSEPDLGAAGVSKRRTTVFYVCLFAAAAVAAVISFGAGEKEEAAPPIAGSYLVEGDHECLGETFDVKQSGEFVNIGDPDDRSRGRCGSSRRHLRVTSPASTGRPPRSMWRSRTRRSRARWAVTS